MKLAGTKIYGKHVRLDGAPLACLIVDELSVALAGAPSIKRECRHVQSGAIDSVDRKLGQLLGEFGGELHIECRRRHHQTLQSHRCYTVRRLYLLQK